MNRFLLLVVLAVAAFLPAAAFAGQPSPSSPAGPILGIVPVHNEAHGGGGAGGNLGYHGGPVMHTNTTYTIYWVPNGYSVSGGYQSIINGFFQNVAAASGSASNVYFSDTQYSDGTGSIAYSSGYGGTYLDTSPLPTSGCSDSYTPVCLSDAQLRFEIAKDITAAGWSANSTSMFFMLTAKNIGSCSSSSSCAFSQYCAYHSSFTSGGSSVIYANMPYADTVPAACDPGQGLHPNGDDADATINVTSHEHNEAITDWQGNAWYDRRGFENGDKCAWTFGASLGSTGLGQYNQVIGSGKYYLQQEWSNHSSGCVLTGL